MSNKVESKNKLSKEKAAFIERIETLRKIKGGSDLDNMEKANTELKDRLEKKVIPTLVDNSVMPEDDDTGKTSESKE